MRDDSIPARLREMVRACGLDIEKHKKIGELSKGYRQRVGLAQAMIHDPEILILDEPTTGLDPNQIVEIRELIRRLGREKTVILSTHILPEVEATCDRILIINRGRIVADGSAESLRKQASGTQVIRVRADGADLNAIYQGMQQLPGVKAVDIRDEKTGLLEVDANADQGVNAAIFHLCVRQGWTLLELTPIETKLEDIFRNLTMN
jgi:ABC-2 type transport system ATP-binding protein